MVGILVSLREGLFSGAFAVSFREGIFLGFGVPKFVRKTVLPTWRRGFASEDITPATSAQPVGHPLHGALGRKSVPHKWPEQFRFRNYIPSLQLNDTPIESINSNQ